MATDSKPFVLPSNSLLGCLSTSMTVAVWPLVRSPMTYGHLGAPKSVDIGTASNCIKRDHDIVYIGGCS